MAKDQAAKDATAAATSSEESWIKEFFRAKQYKRTQGRTVRQVTMAALGLTFLLGAWRLGLVLAKYDAGSAVPMFRIGLPVLFATLGVWISYRVVHIPRFADFLIATEAEMNKVSWPSRTELIRGSGVVLFTIFFLAAVLFAFDFVWRLVFMALGVVSSN
jgi:preprotein translocase subunit SecE